jgi:hypothetical protein
MVSQFQTIDFHHLVDREWSNRNATRSLNRMIQADQVAHPEWKAPKSKLKTLTVPDGERGCFEV